MGSRFLLSTAVVLFLSLGLLYGCASIINKTSQEVSISSSPDQADVQVSNKIGVVVFSGKTPANIMLKRKNEYEVVINLEDYKETKIYIDKEISGAWFGNIICGGIIGLIVDYSNGAAFKLEPDTIHVDLVTASVELGESQLYAVFRALDEEGRVRSLVVPLVKDNT